MHFLTRRILPTQLFDEHKHHKLYNQSRDIFDRANTNVDIFYTTTGRRPSKSDINQVNALVTSLQKSRTALNTKVELASDPDTRVKIGERDYEYIVRRERKLTEWLEKVAVVQQKLQKQVDAETWFRNEQERMSRATTASSTKALLDKPLPPLRKAVYQFEKHPKVSVVPEEKAIEVRSTEIHQET